MTMAMEQKHNNIERLLEMLDSPEVYSEQEIQDIINADDETRQAYRLMVEAKDASRYQHASVPDDEEVEAAWRKFEQRLPEPRRQDHLWHKVAAAIIGVVLISGIAVAAVRGFMYQGKSSQESPVQETALAPGDTLSVSPDTPAIVEPVTFENVPLNEIVDEIAAYYHVKAIFKSDDIRQLRFHYEWNPEAGLPAAIDGLNHFQRVDIEQTGNQLIVKRS